MYQESRAAVDYSFRQCNSSHFEVYLSMLTALGSQNASFVRFLTLGGNAILACLFCFTFQPLVAQEEIPQANKTLAKKTQGNSKDVNSQFQVVYQQAVDLWADSKGNWNQAATKARKAARIATDDFGRDSKQTSAAELLLATIVLYQGRPAEAEKLARHSLEVRIGRSTDPSHESFESAVCLAHCLNNQQKFSESEKLCIEYMPYFNELAGKNDGEKLRLKYLIQFGLSAVRLKHGKAGEKIYRLLVPLQERLTPDDRVALAASNQRLADCLNTQKRYKEAEPFVRKSLALLKEYDKSVQTRKSRLQVAGGLWHLGSNLHAQNPRERDLLDEALKFARESLAIRRQEGFVPAVFRRSAED